MKRISLLILSLLFLATTFQSDKLVTQGWYRQYITNLNGSTIKDMTFLDSLTGFAVTSSNSLLQEYILKTSNGGDNWFINYTFTTPNSNWSFTNIDFINSNTGFAFSWTEMFKTTNSGLNWTQINNGLYCENFSVVNKDTMFTVSSSGFGGGVYRSTNGGLNWQLIWTLGVTSGNPSKIYMFDKNMGFSCVDFQTPYFRKTTNGGFNWFDINDNGFNDIKFVDSLNGYEVCSSFNNYTPNVKKSTDGGITWVAQILPLGLSNYGGAKLALINKDTVWYVGPYVMKNGFPYGILGKTTNGGLNWGYQIPDTSIKIDIYNHLFFSNKNNGWAFFDNIGIHTKIGGNDTTFFTDIKLVPDIVPEKFSLGQNYPNPFNPATNIPFELKEPSHVTLKVFDARGREVKELVNGRWGTGKFIADFDASQFATGIYFYQIIVSGESTRQTFTETRKMMMIK